MPSYVDNLTSGFAGTAAMAVESTSTQSQQSLRQPSAMPNSGFFPGTSDQLGVPAQQQYQPANLAGLNISFQAGMPAIPTTAAQTGMYTSGSPPQNGSGASDFSLDEDLTNENHQRPGNSRRANGKLHARETKTKRNPKQQMQNKQAQQRYRSAHESPALCISRLPSPFACQELIDWQELEYWVLVQGTKETEVCRDGAGHRCFGGTNKGHEQLATPASHAAGISCVACTQAAFVAASITKHATAL